MEQNKTAAESLSCLLEQEKESSQRLQLQCFFNYILLGQWELARSASSLICESQLKEDRKRVLNALIDVASNPYEQSIGSTTVSSSEQLSWLALQDYERHTLSESQIADTSALRQDIEFRLLLVQECAGTNEKTLHEVYQYFQKHHGTGQAYSQLASFDSSEILWQTVSDFLKQMLRNRPEIGHHLISFLMPPRRTAKSKESETLQGLYLQSINSHIDSLPSTGDKAEEICSKIFQLLSFYDPEPYWNYLQIRQLFTRLINLTRTDSENFSTGKILEALVGRTQGYLVEEFCKLLHEVGLTGVRDVMGDLPEEQRLTLHLLTGRDRDTCWQRYFVSCLKWNKHFLGLIMETCISLVKAEQFETLGHFLTATELQRLKPVVLLACWTFCHSSESARHLLDTLWLSPGPGIHPTLMAGCQKLAYQLSLIKWCLERARPLLERSESQPSYGERATKLLHGLETHSVLYVLHQSTQLAALDSQEVLHLLQNVARGKGAGEKKKPKNVHFQEEIQSHQVKEPVSMEQEHDICIYRSYCAIKNIMDAIVFCFENSDFSLMNPVRVKRVLRPRQLSSAVSTYRITSLSSSEGDESSTPSGGLSDKSPGERIQKWESLTPELGASFEETYKQCVWQRIQQAKEHLKHLYPLAYRVEILENIFSLLFSRHSDILDGDLLMEGESDYEIEGESKADSMENLNMSIISEEDAEFERFTNDLKDNTSSTHLEHGLETAFIPEEKYDRTINAKSDNSNLGKNLQQKHSSLRSRSFSDSFKPFSQSDFSFGFLANEYVVRDILSMLKDALLDLSAAKFTMQGQDKSHQLGASEQSYNFPVKSNSITSTVQSVPKSINQRSPNGTTNSAQSQNTENSSALPDNFECSLALERLLSHTISMSITPDMTQKRLAQLTQYVHEAQWRFQLVAHEQIPRQPGHVLEKVVIVTDDDSYVASVSDQWMVSHGPQPAEGVQTQKSRSSNKRSVNSIGTCAAGLQHPSQQSIIARMLSSPESLLSMSLTRNNLTQAAQVVKLLKISEKSQEAAEMLFTDSFSRAAKSLNALTTGTRETQPSSRKFSLQAVKNAAAAGVANVTLSNLVDNLLANPNIPPLPKPPWLSEFGKENTFAKFFALDTTTAVLLDLSCTVCQSWELCNNIFNIIRTKGTHGRLKETEDVCGSDPPRDKKKSKSPSNRHDIKGCRSFFLQLDSLLQLGHGNSDHWTVSAMQEVSAIAGSASLGGKSLSSLTSPPSSSAHIAGAQQQSLVQRLRCGTSILTALVSKQYDANLFEIQQSFQMASQALLASSRLDRQESINIDEAHFAKSPGVNQPSPLPSPATSHSSSIGSGGSSLSREISGRMEVNVLHQRMKHLIAVMEKCVPHGGLYWLLIHGRFERGLLRNYLLSTYEHVKELAFLVAECESKSAETLILPKNYFSILQNGPVDIFGHLMFVKRVLPARLEKVATKLSLNLTHIIVQSCCPHIPSKHLPPIPTPCSQGVERVGTKNVYNNGSCDDIPGSDPDMLVKIILRDILSAMQEVAMECNARGIFTEACGRQLVKSECYTKLISRLKALQAVDLYKLDSKEKLLCFFTNLLNLMTIHYHLHNIRQCSEAEDALAGQREEGVCWGLTGLEGKHLLDMVTKLGAFCYRVGQLEILSLFDLKYVMLHCGQNLSHKWKSLVTNGAEKLASEDPMAIFMPSAEPCLLFVVSDGCLSSPPVQVLESEKLTTQLKTAAETYLQHTVIMEPTLGQITLPLLLTTFSPEDAGKKFANQNQFESLLSFVSQYASSSQAQILDEMRKASKDEDRSSQEVGVRPQLSLEISLSEYSTEFAYVFKMEDVAVQHIQPETSETSASPKVPGHFYHSPSSILSLSAFLPQHFLLESSGSQMEEVSMAKPASYQLTPVTLDYVRETSALVATLLTLLCSDELDDIETQFTEDYFQSGNVPHRRTSSDISVVDIRSYRYHRLVDDFPILQRHLLTYIIPLAGADNPEISHSGEPILKFVTNVIDEDVKMCLFSLHDSFKFLDMLHTMASRLAARRQWHALIPVLRSIPEVVVDKYPHLQLLHDFVISCWAQELSANLPTSSVLSVSTVSKPNSNTNLLYKVRQLYCPDTQARVVLAICDSLPVDWGLDLLELCLARCCHPGLCAAIQSKHHFLTVYYKLSSCIKTAQIKLSMQQSDITLSTPISASSKEFQQVLAKYEDWRHLAQKSQKNPKEVVAMLMQAGDFTVTRDWTRLHPLPPDLMMEINVWYLMSLLTTCAPDTLPAYQTLEDMRKTRPGDCVEVCQCLLQRLEDPHKVKFTTSYMLHRLIAILPEEELENLRLRRIGAKALLCIPMSMRGDYSHLVSFPHLILEQLLMNMKAELAGQVFRHIHKDFTQIKESKLQVAQEQFNSLLTSYARKALEVTVVQVTDNLSGALGSPSPSSTESGSSKDEGRTTPSQRLTTEAVKVRKRYLETSASPKAGSTPPFFSIPQRRESTSSVIAAPPVSSEFMKNASGKFIMPILPPTEEEWVPDNKASVCMVCKLERFSMFNRRHHCRRCGRVVCAACSTKRSQVRDISARTCDECYEQIFGPRESRARDEQEVYSQRMKESLSGASPKPQPSSYSRSPSRFLPIDHGHTRSLSSAVQHNLQEWKLKTDEDLNSYIRNEFYYEQAPSVALCMSVLQHHTDLLVSGQLILTMCDDLSSFLQPLAPGIPNLEVDYGLIISIIRELLFRAKMIFLKGSDSNMIAKCDAYQASVDLLKILLEANYPDLPTLLELSKMDTARRLRDKLVKDERLQLAMEVCTKCGVEATGVWLAWGRACLQCGDFLGARDKFAHCLKAPKDKNQLGASSHLLTEIIDLLESLPPTGMTDIQALLSNPTVLSGLICMPVGAEPEETNVESKREEECVHYLRTYGTYSDQLRFLLKNGYWNKALKFVIDHHCSTDIFVESILQPALQAGEMTRLTGQLLMLDSSLDQWMPYLSASCRYLLKNRHYHVLYNLQIFMKDFLRAAMTCITHFYQQGALSYMDLANRLQFLFIAQEHMQAFLDPLKWGAVRHPLHSPLTSPIGQGSKQLNVDKQNAAQLCMSKEDVTRHLRTVALQIEVTQFLEQCLSRTGEAAAVASQYVAQAKTTTTVPTLFGNQEQRKAVVKMVLLSGGKLSVAFDLALRIFSECHLKTVMVLKQVICDLLTHQRSSDMLELLHLTDQRQILDDEEWDEVVSTALLDISEKNLEARDETETLIKMIRKEHNKINALIMTGKLRSAYLIAAKANRVQDITRIMAAAEHMGQAAVCNICKKWLEQHHKK